MPQLHPNLATYQTLLDGVVSAKGQQRQLQRSAKFAESLLKLMLDIFFNKTQGDRTDITSNGSDSSAESKQVDQSSAVANIDAQEVIDLTYAFHKVMTLYCQANYVAAAERLLRELEQLNDTGGNNCIPLTVDSYTIVLSGWAKRGAPREAEYVLNGMLNRSSRAKKQDRIIMPTKNNFESCLGAWVMASTSVSGQRAELLLLKMQELHEKKFDAKPCVKSFSKVISAWVNSKHQEATIRADAILTMMNEIDWSDETDMTSFHKTLADIYLQVMKLWSSYSKPNAPEKCSQLLLQLNANTGFQHVKSVTVQRLYAALITAWARSGRKNIIASRVQEIFAEMNAQRRTGGVFATNDNLSFVWDSAVYHALLLAYAQAGDGTKAEAMLKSMLQEYLEHHSSGVENSNSNTPTKVDTKCFNLVLLAWSKSSEPDATMRAEDLFLQMLQLRNRDHVDVRPDVVSYNAVLAAFSGTNDRLRARRGYDYFRQLTNTKDPTCRPTTVSYTLAIRVWSRLPTLEALERVQFLLDEMKTGDRSVRPDATTYKAFLSVLKKCTFLSADERTRRMEDIQREWDKLGSHRC